MKNAGHGSHRGRIRFGSFEFDIGERQLRKHGVGIRLQPQQFAVLELLVKNAGAVVTREEIQHRVWGFDTHIDFDRGINKVISRLRSVLSDTATQPRYIETIPKVGFRFLAAIDNPITSLAVLPLVNSGNDPADEYFADGMTEELITTLCRAKDFRVISRTSVMQYKRSEKSPSDMARELNVDAVVEGSVLRSGDRIRITAALILAHGEHQVWRESYERADFDVLRLQHEVATAIASSVCRTVLEVPQVRHGSWIPNLDAREALLKGRFFWNKRTPADLGRSVAYLECAVQIDPLYAQAWAELADAHVVRGILGLGPAGEAFEKARVAAERAVSLDKSLAEAHTSLAEVYKDYDWDWEAAEHEFELSLALNPHYAIAHQFYAQLLAMLGRHAEAIWHVEEARSCDPLSSTISAFTAFILIQAGQYERALLAANRALEIDPGFALTHWFIGQAYQLQRRLPDAIHAMETAVRLPGSLPVMEAQLGYAYARSGDQLRAEAVLDSLKTRQLQQYISPMAFAMIHLGMGNIDSVFECLEEAYLTRTFRILAVTDPFFAELRSHHRYQSLLARLKLPSPS